MKKLSLLLLLALQAHGADHVVLIVWDGLRPDSINETNTPTLARMAREGVFFANHHSVYITSTEVNGVALATGASPAHNGIIANREYRPTVDPLRPVMMESAEAIRKSDVQTRGNYLGVPTLVEVLRDAGRAVALAGTKPVTRLFDRENFEFPSLWRPSTSPNTLRDAETTQRLIGRAWDNGVPPFSLLWLSEPDLTQHQHGPGSPQFFAALGSSDQNLARVLDKLQAHGVRESTDVLVVSDHGFSTVSRMVDVAAGLRRAGFPARREYKRIPRPGEIVVVGNSGSVLLYVIGHDVRVIGQLVEYLQRQDFTGVIFTRKALPGTFTLEQARLNTPNAPDVVVSLRWFDKPSRTGVPGLLVSDGKGRGPKGTHASLSRYDLHNTLIAAGPDFCCGTTNSFPSGNLDLAPTILAILGVPASVKMDGRILTEPVTDSHRDHLTSGTGSWSQYLDVTECGGAFYLDEGNGSSQVVHSEEKRVTH